MQIVKAPLSFGLGVYKQSWFETRGYRSWFALLLFINSLPLLLPIFIPGLGAKYPFVAYLGNLIQLMLIVGLYRLDAHFHHNKEIKIANNFACFMDHKLFYRMLPWLLAYGMWTVLYFYLNTYLVVNNIPDHWIFAISLVVTAFGAVFTQFVVPLMVLGNKEVGDALVFALRGGLKNWATLLLSWIVFYVYMAIALIPMGTVVYFSQSKADFQGILPVTVMCILTSVVLMIAGYIFFSTGLLYAPYLMYRRIYRAMNES